MSERAFSFLRINERASKPRTGGLTEIRGPYYTPMGKRYLQDVLETMGGYVDSLKFARSEEHTSELQSRRDLVCRLLLEKKNKISIQFVFRIFLLLHYTALPHILYQ